MTTALDINIAFFDGLQQPMSPLQKSTRAEIQAIALCTELLT
jgi:hypothetical protein